MENHYLEISGFVFPLFLVFLLVFVGLLNVIMTCPAGVKAADSLLFRVKSRGFRGSPPYTAWESPPPGRNSSQK